MGIAIYTFLCRFFGRVDGLRPIDRTPFVGHLIGSVIERGVSRGLEVICQKRDETGYSLPARDGQGVPERKESMSRASDSFTIDPTTEESMWGCEQAVVLAEDLYSRVTNDGAIFGLGPIQERHLKWQTNQVRNAVEFAARKAGRRPR
jgi:hypothetical protein